jgi:hypothetical protein
VLALSLALVLQQQTPPMGQKSSPQHLLCRNLPTKSSSPTSPRMSMRLRLRCVNIALVYIGMVLTNYSPRNCSTRQSALSATSPSTTIAPAGRKVSPRYISRRKEMALRPSSSITIGSSMGVSIACFHLFASLPFSYPILRRHALHFRSGKTVALCLCSGNLLAFVSRRFFSRRCGFKYVCDGVTPGHHHRRTRIRSCHVRLSEGHFTRRIDQSADRELPVPIDPPVWGSWGLGYR